MKAIIKTSILLLSSSFVFIQSKAQYDFNKFEWGVMISGFVYQGDLTPSQIGSYKTLKPGITLFMSKELMTRISLRTNLAIGSLKGDDAKYSSPSWRLERALKFTTPVIEISELVQVDILTKGRFIPYVNGGVGLTLLKIDRDWSQFNTTFFSNQPKTMAGLDEDIQHSVPKRIIVLPAGIGAKYALDETISLIAETSYRVTFTDYLDGFSKVANPDKKDYYFTHSIGIAFNTSSDKHGSSKNRLGCPQF
jgi:opacity protein-like surface antigen